MRCERHRRARPALGTLVDITLDVADAADAARAFDAAFAEVQRIHDLMTAHDDRSDVVQLSRHAHRRPVRVDPETLAVLELAQQLHALSDGVFDPCVGARMARSGHLPPLDVAPGGSLADLVIGDDGWVTFKQALHLDFGGIAKGHAVDCAVRVLIRHGVAGALVNAGGDMRAFGVEAHPVQLRMAKGVQTVAMLKDAALASSCNAGQLSTHLDARTGEAIQRADAIVVHANSAAAADALTKVAMVSPALADRACHALGAQWRAFPFSA